jgi:hypothetical protein
VTGTVLGMGSRMAYVVTGIVIGAAVVIVIAAVMFARIGPPG